MRQLTDAEHERLLEAARERDRLVALINTPELVNFREAVLREALHQRERHGLEHDDGKTPADWFWLVAHLATRAFSHVQQLHYLERLGDQPAGGYMDTVARHHREKAAHHLVTTAAALANWHARLVQETGLAAEAAA